MTRADDGMAPGVRDWLRAEGLAVLVLGIVLYASLDLGAWWTFGLLFLAPDLSMLGYLAGPRIGATAYNLGHSYVGPVALLAAGLAGPASLLGIGVIWSAHIGFDRAMGYGLKLPGGFRETHLGRIGR